MDGLITAAVAGLTAGGAYALLGVCVVFTYRLVAVINFTAAAIGTTGTFVFVALAESGMPLFPATLSGLAMGGLTGIAVGLVMMTWFAETSATNKAAVTVALLVGMVAVGLRLTGGQHPHYFPTLFPGSAFRLAGVEVTVASVLTIALALVFTIAADLLLARTRIGLQLRALSERPVTAELIGVPVRGLALLVWGVTGLATTFSLMIIAPQRTPDFMSLSLLVVPALAAALIGLFRNFWMALFGGILTGVLEGLMSQFSGLSEYRGAIPFLIILAVLLWLQRGVRWDEAR